MNGQSKARSGLQAVVWPVVIIGVMLIVSAVAPVVASAETAAQVNPECKAIGSIQSGGEGGSCTTVTVNTSPETPNGIDGCTSSQGYHATHWPPASSLPTLYFSNSDGTIQFPLDNQVAFGLISSAVKGDKYVQMMQQLIAAYLNQLFGAGISDTYLDYYNEAVACAKTYIQTGVLCSNSTELNQYLTDYNMGTAVGNPDHCPNGPQWTYSCQIGEPPVEGMGCQGYYGTYYLYKRGKWVIDNVDYTNPYFCMTADQCPSASSIDTCHTSLPANPVITVQGIELQIMTRPGVDTSDLSVPPVTTLCPINEVLRAPYPRSLVNVPTNFFLQPAIYDNVNGYPSAPVSPRNLDQLTDEDGNPTPDGYDKGVWKNLVITVRSHRFSGGEIWFDQVVPKPYFSFTDRLWNNPPYPTVQYGIKATYTYRTSSQGLPDANYGRAFDMVNKQVTDMFNLPAYKVLMTTYVGHDWKASVDLAHKYWAHDGDCVPVFTYPDGSIEAPDNYSTEGCPAGQAAPGHIAYTWQPYTTGWNGIDMTQSKGTPYDVQQESTSGGIFKNVLYTDAPSGIWVPVIEIQSVLRSRSVYAGGDVPPAESGSYNK